MPKLGWIFGPGMCARPDALGAAGVGSGSVGRRVVCAPSTSYCECPIHHVRWSYDAAPVLHQFAREVALSVVHLWDPPPIVLRYLKTGDESIREATRSIMSPPDVAGRARTYYARDSARTATWQRTGDIARTAAWSAAHAASKAVTCDYSGVLVGVVEDAAQERYSRRLAKMLTAGRRIYAQKSMP